MKPLTINDLLDSELNPMPNDWWNKGFHPILGIPVKDLNRPHESRAKTQQL